MAEIRRSRPGSQRDAGRAPRQGVATRSSRRIISRPGKVPQWAYIALLAGPGLGIVILLLISAFRGSKPAEEKTTNPNEEISALEQEIRGLEAGYREAMQLWQKEDPSAKAKVEALRERMYGWIDTWDRLFESFKDPDGNLPPEYQGYNRTRSRVNMLINDLNKNAPI